MPGSSTRYGSDLIVDLLHLYDIPYVSLNPGSSFRGLHDSLVNYGDNKPEMIECNHEELAVGIAHGYAKATGRPMAAILHDVVGLLHGAMASTTPTWTACRCSSWAPRGRWTWGGAVHTSTGSTRRSCRATPCATT